MSSLARYPYLRSLYEELTRLTVEESCAGPRAPATISEGRDVSRVKYPGLGDYWLTPPQLRVVKELMSALLHSASPEVDQGHLLRVAGTGAARLRDVFARSAAWGELVLPGSRAGSYRLFAPPVAEEDDGPEDDWAA